MPDYATDYIIYKIHALDISAQVIICSKCMSTFTQEAMDIHGLQQ
jgi:hypothetical protein